MDDATARCGDDFDGRPSAPAGARELEAVHRTRHFDIGEDHGEVAPGLQQQEDNCANILRLGRDKLSAGSDLGADVEFCLQFSLPLRSEQPRADNEKSWTLSHAL